MRSDRIDGRISLLFLFLTVCLSFAGSVSPRVRALEDDRPIIDSVEILNENVFDTGTPEYDKFLFKLANGLHIVTRRPVIRRELLLGKGDPYDSSLVNESVRNLRGLPYLFKTEICLKRGEAGENIMVVKTSDKWSTIAQASFHRSGRRDDFQFGFEENNLLGHGIFMSHDYFILEDDRNYYQAEIQDRRFLGRNVFLDLFYSDNPRAGRLGLVMGKPYYSLSQRWSVEASFEKLNERIDYYLNEILAARDRLTGKTYQSIVSYRLGPNHIKYYISLSYRFRENIWRSRRFENIDIIAPEVTRMYLPDEGRDSIIHFVQLGFRLQQLSFGKYIRLNRFHKPEDVNHGIDVSIAIGRAFPKDQKNYYWGLFDPQYTVQLRPALLIFGCQWQQWYDGIKSLRRIINPYFKAFLRYHENQTLVARVSYIYDRLPDKALRLYLDEDNFLRGYPAFFKSGEKRVVVNVENRIFSNIEILSVGLGGVLFADIGNIWTRDDKFSVSRNEAAFGAGLRFGVTRSVGGEIIRVDGAYAPSLKDWQISVGTGQFF